MAHTAQFRTLTIINARLFYGKSPFVDATRNRILFQPESWNGKAVNDVGPRQQNFDGAANGEHQAIVYAQQFRLTTLFRLFSRQHVAYDLRNAVLRILVTPIPLINCNLYRQRVTSGGSILTSATTAGGLIEHTNKH